MIFIGRVIVYVYDSVMMGCDVARERYHVTLVATDAGSPSLSSSLSVLIVVDDVNDNRPRFDSTQYNMTLDVTAPIGSTVGRLSARDADLGLNGQVRYRFAAKTQVCIYTY